jgi:hypothetical protein
MAIRKPKQPLVRHARVERLYAAFHEAGHAVIALHVGLGLNHVTIARWDVGEWVGHCRTQPCANPTIEAPSVELTEAGVVFSWAGYFAALRAGCDEQNAVAGARSDLDRAHALEPYIARPSDVLVEHSQRLVEQQWSAIEAVAKALLRRRTLTADQVVKIVAPWLNVPLYGPPPGKKWPPK